MLDLYISILISIAVSVVSMTVTKAVVFKPLRDYVKKKSEFFGELLSCPFCFSFWLALPLQAMFKIRLISSAGFLIKDPANHIWGFSTAVMVTDLGISYMVIIAFASFFSGWIYKSISQIS